MALNIPIGQIRAFGKILQFDAVKLKSLLEIFRSAHADLIPFELSKQVAKVAGIRDREAMQIVQALLSLYAARVSQKAPVEAFLQEVCESIQEAGIKPKNGNLELFKKFITDLLSLKGAIEITSKALNILMGNERNFVGARIFTDIRPVFKENPSDPPAGAVIVHTIRLDYVEGNARKGFFLALDSSDLQALKSVIERASLKEACVVPLLSKLELPVVMPS